MDARELELTLEAVLSTGRPTPRDLRDALVDYYVLAARPFIAKGLAHTHPGADEGLVRRMLLSRLTTLWHGMSSRWDDPTVADLAKFRRRIEAYACAQTSPELSRVRGHLDDVFLGATVTERLKAVQKRAPVRKLKLIEGGGEVTEPRGRLQIVPAERVIEQQERGSA